MFNIFGFVTQSLHVIFSKAQLLLGDVSALSCAMCECVCVKSLQSCLTLFDSLDYSPPGSSVHGILQARIWSG